MSSEIILGADVFQSTGEDRERLCCNYWSRKVTLLFGTNEEEELRLRGDMTGTIESEEILILLVTVEIFQSVWHHWSADMLFHQRRPKRDETTFHKSTHNFFR